MARELVVYHRRPHGQSRYAALREIDPPSARIGEVVAYIRANLGTQLSVERLAAQASLSQRQFNRAFLAETGLTPAKAVERMRAEAALRLVECGRQSMGEIAWKSGFADPDRMRRAFMRWFGRPPQEIRRQALLR